MLFLKKPNKMERWILSAVHSKKTEYRLFRIVGKPLGEYEYELYVKHKEEIYAFRKSRAFFFPGAPPSYTCLDGEYEVRDRIYDKLWTVAEKLTEVIDKEMKKLEEEMEKQKPVWSKLETATPIKCDSQFTVTTNSPFIRDFYGDMVGDT